MPRLGAIFVPLNWRLTVPELDFILGDCTPTVLVHDAAFEEVATRVAASASISARIAWDGESHGAAAYEDVLAAAGTPCAPADNDHDDRADRDVHVGDDRASEGGDHHARDDVLERGEPDRVLLERAGHGQPRRPPAVPHRWSERASRTRRSTSVGATSCSTASCPTTRSGSSPMPRSASRTSSACRRTGCS